MITLHSLLLMWWPSWNMQHPSLSPAVYEEMSRTENTQKAKAWGVHSGRRSAVGRATAEEDDWSLREAEKSAKSRKAVFEIEDPRCFAMTLLDNSLGKKQEYQLQV